MIIKKENNFLFLTEEESSLINSIYNVSVYPIERLHSNIVSMNQLDNVAEDYDLDKEDFDFLLEEIAIANSIDKDSITVSIDEGFINEYLDIISKSNCNFIINPLSDNNPDCQLVDFVIEEYILTKNDNLLELLEEMTPQEKQEDLWKHMTGSGEKTNQQDEKNTNNTTKNIKSSIYDTIKKGKDKVGAYYLWARKHPKGFAKHAGAAAGAVAGVGLLAHRISVLRNRMKRLQYEQSIADTKRKGIIGRLIQKIKNIINRLLGRKNVDHMGRPIYR